MDLFKGFRRKSKGEVVTHVIVSLIFFVVAISYIYILVWAFLAGLKTHTEVVDNPFGLPKEWHWKNYFEVFRLFEVNGKNFLDMLFNSIWFSMGGVVLQQFVTMTFAYCCSKYKFPGSTIPFVLILFMSSLPIYGSSGALYILLHNWGLIDSYAQILVSASGFSIPFLFYTAFFQNLSWTFAEAAMIDGANDFSIYFRVFLPQTMPIFTALCLTNGIAAWNSYESALIYLPNLPTLPVGIYQFNVEMLYRARLDILFAACVLVALPAIILLIAFNKTITTNVSLGGIKG